jgi:hypothetical protein
VWRSARGSISASGRKHSTLRRPSGVAGAFHDESKRPVEPTSVPVLGLTQDQTLAVDGVDVAVCLGFDAWQKEIVLGHDPTAQDDRLGVEDLDHACK